MSRQGQASQKAWWKRAVAVLIPLSVGGAAVVLLVVQVPRWMNASGAVQVPLHRVELKEFVHEVVQQGTLESASNVEIRCEVDSDDSSRGTQILEIVPEGTYVETGQVLARLDSSAREQEMVKEQLEVSAAEAEYIGATNSLINAKAALREYLQGQFVQEQKQLQAQVLNAEEDRRQAVERYNASEKMYNQGFITQLQLQADKFGVERADVELSVAKRRLQILEQFTRPKRELELQNQIESAETSVEWRKYALDLRKKELAEIEEDIRKCTIKAPLPGQVVYANDPEYWAGPVIIEEGAWVRERQVIIRLPDPKRMQVKTKVNESRVSSMRTGMLAEIRLDARREMPLRGVVSRVNEYPMSPSHWSSANVQEYEAIVSIDGEPAGLRPGLTAEIKICMARMRDQIIIPVDAIFESNSRHFCVMPSQGHWVAQEVEIGPTNGRIVVIREGLRQGDIVAAGAAKFRNRVVLPNGAIDPTSALASAHASARGPL